INQRNVPEDCFGKSFDVIGRVLSQKVEEGQKVTKEMLVPIGDGVKPAPDMKLYTFLPSDASILDVLTVGCKVDVMFIRIVENELPRPNTILYGITVKALDGNYTTSPKQGTESIDSTRKAGPRTVTLELYPWECEAMNMAKSLGTVQLVMCNPNSQRSM